MLNIVVIVYNRPERAKEVVARAVQARPDNLFIVGDGPVPGDLQDARRVAATRKAVDEVCLTSSLNYKSNYAPVNLGLRERVETGLDWAFEQADRLIILEDDCLVDSSFFMFCEELLERYAAEPSIGRISAQAKWPTKESPHSYDFVLSPGIWGWATWRDRWHAYRKWSNLHPSIGLFDVIRDLRGTHGLFRFVVRIKLLSDRGNRRSWGVRLSVFMKLTGLIGVSPRVDLVTNKGFGQDSTNTKVENLPGPKSRSISFPLDHPRVICISPARERAGSRREAMAFVKHTLGRWRKLKQGEHVD